MRLGRLRDLVLLLAVAAYSAGYATPGLAVLFLLALVEVLTRSWRWIPTAIDAPLLALALAAVASALASQWRGVSLMLALLFGLTAVVSVRSVAVYAHGGADDIVSLLRIWVAGGAAAALWGLARSGAAGWAAATTPGVGENGLGMTLAVALTLTVALAVTGLLRGRWTAGALTAVLLAGLILTRSRGGWLGAAVGVTLAILLGAPRPARLRLLLWTAVLTVAGLTLLARWPALGGDICSLVRPEAEANRSRLLIWRAIPRMVADHPLLGTGYGTFVQAYPRYRLPEATELYPPFAHNLWLNFAVETGLVGLAALLALCVVGLRAAWQWVQSSPPQSEGRGAAVAVFAALLVLLTTQMFDGSIMSVHLGFGFLALLILGPVGIRAAETPLYRPGDARP
ncbi:MAG: O-antigen ligase family protein [Armatimonadota bacterium]|nr:O-antigen ligase family protein [Armatimonadota bacterium]